VRIAPGDRDWRSEREKPSSYAVGWSLVPMYSLVGPLTEFVLLGHLVWNMVKVIVTVIVWDCTMYRGLDAGLGCWALSGAFHSSSSSLPSVRPARPLLE
jgi:hypothetical protein